MDRSRFLPALAVTLIFGSGLAGAAAAETDAPVTSAGSKGVPTRPEPASAEATAAQIGDWIKAETADDGGPLETGRTADRRIHGEVSAWVGTNGIRGFAASAVIPVGQHASLALAVSRESGRGGYGGQYTPWGYGFSRAASACRSRSGDPNQTDCPTPVDSSGDLAR